MNDFRLHYGLGDAKQADRVEVRWPSGLVEEFGPQAANRVVTLVEGEGRAAAKGE